jgi:hypothetical protein
VTASIILSIAINVFGPVEQPKSATANIFEECSTTTFSRIPEVSIDFALAAAALCIETSSAFAKNFAI